MWKKITRDFFEGKTIVFESFGITIDCKCANCGWEVPITFFIEEYDVRMDAGACGECGEWEMMKK